MEEVRYIILGVLILIVTLLLKYVFQCHKKRLEHLGEDEELDALARAYPANQEMCKEYLKMLHNENVKVEESEGKQASLYIAVMNKILIADKVSQSYTRIQTIAHECLHSVQSKRILWFNFILSNIYLLYFILTCVLLLFKILPFKMMFLVILFLLGSMYIMVRGYLENDAMTKARYLAKEYMEQKKISSPEEIEKLVEGFDKINQVGLPFVNYQLFFDIMIKAFIFTTLCLLF